MSQRTTRFLSLAALGATLFFLFVHEPRAPATPPGVRPLATAAIASPSPLIPPCFPANPPACDGDCAALLTIIQNERRKSTWNEYYGDVSAEIYRRGAATGIFVEIGTAYGGLSLAMLRAHPELRVIAVDPFLGGYDGRDSMSDLFADLPKKYGADFPALWAHALAYEAGQEFGCRYALRHMRSEAGAAQLPSRSVDVVFVDGDHTRAGVTRDIEAWRRVLKLGRVMLFNDYQADRWPGVVEAVNEFASQTEQSVWYLPQKSWGNVGLYNLPLLFEKSSD